MLVIPCPKSSLVHPDVLMLEPCLQSGLGEGVMQALPGAEQSFLEEERSVSAALTLTPSSQADKNELENVQMSRARQGRWGSSALQMRECASDMFLEESERTGQVGYLNLHPGRRQSCVSWRRNVKFICLEECSATTCSMKCEFGEQLSVTAGRCGVGLMFI